MFRTFTLTFLFCISMIISSAQSETLDNRAVISMSKSGLSTEIILKKITLSRVTNFDVSATSLIELKKAGVDDAVIAAMMDRQQTALAVATEPVLSVTPSSANLTISATLASARTIAFGKSSLQPSRQALEKELIKRKDFKALNLSILRYKEQADLFVDIGYVAGSWITHRYVYRIYDRHSGAVVAAGETTSWGSLAENLARHISKSLTAARSLKAS